MEIPDPLARQLKQPRCVAGRQKLVWISIVAQNFTLLYFAYITGREMQDATQLSKIAEQVKPHRKWERGWLIRPHGQN
jgi:hypothetical protein